MWDDLIRTALGVADAIVGDGLKCTVTHKACTSLNDYGEPVLDPTGTARTAVVTDTNTAVRTQRGETVVAAYRVLFLEAVTVTLQDEITLPDGRHAPILKVDSGIVSASGALLTEVWCG